MRDNVGATEPADTGVVLDDVSDARLPVVADEPANSLTVVELRGAQRVWASSYGGPFTLTPEERPTNAFDGDPRTAWRVDRITATSDPTIGIELGREVDASSISLRDPIGRPGTKLVTRVRVTLDGTRTIDADLPLDRGNEPMHVALDGKPFHQLEITVLGAESNDGSAGFGEIEIPGVHVEELTVMPTAVLQMLGANAAGAPLAFALSRERANPAEPVRADPELSMRRILDLPAPLTFTLDGTARLNPGADDALLDQLLGEGRAGIASVKSSEHLPGAITSRASAAVDGSTATSWSTPFAGIAGQTWNATLTAPVTLNTLELDVVTDEHHSQPREITLAVGDNDPVKLTIPALPVGPLDSTTHVSLPLPHPLQGNDIGLTIDSYDARTTPDWYSGQPIEFPAAIAEIGLPVSPPKAATAAVDTGCRSDLVTIDGTPLPVRISGDTGPTRRDPLTVTPCTSTLSLTAGRHEIATTIGLDSGIDIDRLVLRSANFDTAPAAVAAPTVTIDSQHATSVDGTVQSDGTPFWLVLDQSINKGWHVAIDGAKVDGPHAIDSFANGWLITPAHAGTFTVHVRWTPQRSVDIALVLSAIAVVICVVLAVRRPWRAIARAGDPPLLVWPARRVDDDPIPIGIGAIVLAFVCGALFVHPIAGVAFAAVFVALRRWPGRRGLLQFVVPLGVALAALHVLWFQSRDGYQPGGRWPEYFAAAHVVALASIVLLGLLAVPPRRRTDT